MFDFQFRFVKCRKKKRNAIARTQVENKGGGLHPSTAGFGQEEGWRLANIPFVASWNATDITSTYMFRVKHKASLRKIINSCCLSTRSLPLPLFFHWGAIRIMLKSGTSPLLALCSYYFLSATGKKRHPI